MYIIAECRTIGIILMIILMTIGIILMTQRHSQHLSLRERDINQLLLCITNIFINFKISQMRSVNLWHKIKVTSINPDSSAWKRKNFGANLSQNLTFSIPKKACLRP